MGSVSSFGSSFSFCILRKLLDGRCFSCLPKPFFSAPCANLHSGARAAPSAWCGSMYSPLVWQYLIHTVVYKLVKKWKFFPFIFQFWNWPKFLPFYCNYLFLLFWEIQRGELSCGKYKKIRENNKKIYKIDFVSREGSLTTYYKKTTGKINGEFYARKAEKYYCKKNGDIKWNILLGPRL